MKKVLITGIGGFIGKNLAIKFQNIGYSIWGWDVCETNIEHASLSFFDMTQYRSVEEKLKEATPDLIIHCAGCADVGKSVTDPKQDFEGNVVVTHNLLFAAHALNLTNTRIIFLSSAGVYGNPQQLPISENSTLSPLSPYALHKAIDEQICAYMHQNYDMDIKIVRIFSAYGRGLKKQIFWDMYRKAKETGKLEMWGTGNESRDYIHINDVTEAITLIALKALKEELLFNVANGEEVTIRMATELFAKVMDIDKCDISFNGHTREGDPVNWKSDISRLRNLGYQKSITLKDGIMDYINWLSE